MSHINIGIVTLPGHFNFGNRLQCYAVSRIYERCGLSSEELVLIPRFNLKRTVARFARKLLQKERVNPEDMMSEARKAAFARFDSHVKSRTIDCLDSCLADEYDLFSVGSDQTWNPPSMHITRIGFFSSLLAPSKGLPLPQAWELSLSRGVSHARLQGACETFLRYLFARPKGLKLSGHPLAERP